MELFTGTFYLLMLAIGLAAGALAAHAGGSVAAQLLAAAVVGSAGVVSCYVFRKRTRAPSPHRATAM